MQARTRLSTVLDILWALAAACLVVAALLGFASDRAGVIAKPVTVEGTPATIFRAVRNASGGDPPVVVIAHGFAGSQQLMQAFAYTAARNGITALSFDFLGHGRNPAPLGGSVTEIAGATAALVRQTAAMVSVARTLGDGQVALLGHSMASDILIRVALADPAIAATVAVSAFSRVVTANEPRNLLLIAGQWEPRLADEALRVLALTAGPSAAPGITYGDIAAGTGRRFIIAPHVEHVSVLYSEAALTEARDWLRAAFGLRDAPLAPADRGGIWIVLLLFGLVLAVRPMVRLLPVLATPPTGHALPWAQAWAVVLVPALLTPLILRPLPTRFLPVLVADYLALHFALYGALTAAMLALMSRRAAAGTPVRSSAIPAWRMLLAAALAVLVTAGPLFVAIDAVVTAVRPIPERGWLIAALLAGTTLHFVAAERAMRGPLAGRGLALALPLAFLASLAIAVSLDLRRLFFLAIIVPVIVPFLLVFGLFGRWLHRRTGHALPAGIAQAIAFAFASGATFPMMTG